MIGEDRRPYNSTASVKDFVASCRTGVSMTSLPLPLSLADLLACRVVESDRLEFKEGWNPPAVFRSVCAFANDFHNHGGGYILASPV